MEIKAVLAFLKSRKQVSPKLVNLNEYMYFGEVNEHGMPEDLGIFKAKDSNSLVLTKFKSHLEIPRFTITYAFSTAHIKLHTAQHGRQVGYCIEQTCDAEVKASFIQFDEIFSKKLKQNEKQNVDEFQRDDLRQALQTTFETCQKNYLEDLLRYMKEIGIYTSEKFMSKVWELLVTDRSVLLQKKFQGFHNSLGIKCLNDSKDPNKYDLYFGEMYNGDLNGSGALIKFQTAADAFPSKPTSFTVHPYLKHLIVHYKVPISPLLLYKAGISELIVGEFRQAAVNGNALTIKFKHYKNHVLVHCYEGNYRNGTRNKLYLRLYSTNSFKF